MKNTMLQFDFSDDNHKEPMVFTNPIRLITTNQANELARCWAELEAAIEEGYYVAGYVSYEAAYSLYGMRSKYDNEALPLLSFGVFEAPTSSITIKKEAYHIGAWKMQASKESYQADFQSIMNAINNGLVEQVNYTVKFKADFDGDAFHYYNVLKNAQDASYAAYLEIENKKILSVSPELFFRVKDDKIRVKPMKGTIKRGKTYEEDMAMAKYLRHSEKNKHENEMITNLMIEELKNVAQEDSIHVTKAFTVEKYPTLYQMTSTVEGTLLPDQSIIHILQQLFPCGSISGAPKKETLQLIHELERLPRDVYCGAIGYITPNREAIFNVPIRTVMIDTATKIASYGAGGAITAQSTMEDEYEEVLTKTKVLTYEADDFSLLETIGLYDGEYIVLEEHLKRLKKSSAYFSYIYDEAHIKEILSSYQKKYKQGSYRLRMTLAKNGKVTTTIAPLQAAETNQVAFAKAPIRKENRLLYHKTTNRSLYTSHQQAGLFDTLLWNEDGEVTEFTIGNVVLEIDGKLYTPPVKAGLLPGTYRENLLQNQIIKERTLYKEDFTNNRKVWLINSVRKWVPVYF